MPVANPFAIVVLNLVAATLIAGTASPSPAPRLSFGVRARLYNASLFTTRGASAKETRSLTTGYSGVAIFHGDYRANAHVTLAASLETVSGDSFTPQNALSSLLESYVHYASGALAVKAGNQLFTSPWAGSHDVYGSAPAAFQGIDATYERGAWVVQIAHFTRYHGFGSTAFNRTTLLTASPTGGFDMFHAGYTSPPARFTGDVYAYRMHDILRETWVTGRWKMRGAGAPFIAVQYGAQTGDGASVLGALKSSVAGVQAGFTPWKSLTLTFGYDVIPWRQVRVVLPNGARCDSQGLHPTYQVSNTSATPEYFLPIDAAQCATSASGTTILYAGGWASPYSDSFAADPLYTTGLIEGMVDRRSPGQSVYAEADYTSSNGRLSFTTARGSYNYSNPLARQSSTEWDNILTYRFSSPQTPYHGLLARFGYIQIFKTNTAYADGSPFLGGHPTLHYRRIQLEYSL